MTLDELMVRIREQHTALLNEERSSLQRRVALGRDLIAAKQMVSESGGKWFGGKWFNFLDNMSIAKSTAKDWMALARTEMSNREPEPKPIPGPETRRFPAVSEENMSGKSEIPSFRAGAAEKKPKTAAAENRTVAAAKRKAAVYAALISNPTQTIAKLRNDFKVSGELVINIRKQLIHEGKIPFIKERNKAETRWQLPPAYLLKTLGILDTFRMYAVDISKKMPKDAREALVQPTTAQEADARDGIIVAIRDIRRLLGELEDEITGVTNIVRAENRFLKPDLA